MIEQTAKDNIKFTLFSCTLLLICLLIKIPIIFPVSLICLIAYLKARKLYPKPYPLLKLGLLYLTVILISDITARYQLPYFILPFSAIPILATVLFNNLELAFVLTVASAFSAAALFNNNLYVNILFLVIGLVSCILVYGARRRMEVIRVGFLVGLIQALLMLFRNNFATTDLMQYLYPVANGVAASIIVLGILPIFEYLFGTVTNISLLELADFNHPLLQRMILEAPGTYHHSLVVGNLSEAACQAIGANALLARIGAYYHDIGKIEKPEYFSENQGLDQSKHDILSPTISKLVIINHVKDGTELAKKYRLNDKIIDFIQQHHGNSLIYFFYRRALENSEEDQEVKEEGFRYSGPKPNTKETAIVLLADSVEAATRAMKDPTPAKIEELVHKVINNKFIDGQLDECDLKLKDLEKIAKVFIRILGGIYHTRVSYPEKEETSANNHKKSAKENPNQPEKDKKTDK